MRRLLKVCAALLVLFALTQAPFVYRRRHLSRLDAAIRSLNAQRAATDDAGLADYPGALHVHSSLGGHSTGTLAEVVAGARAAHLAFVVMTEHPSAYTDTRAATLSGTHDGVLFVPGTESSESERDRLLAFGGSDTPGGSSSMQPAAQSQPAALPADANAAPTQSLIDRAKAAGQLVFVAHPETFEGWQTARGFDGMEVYNLHADAKNARPLTLFFDGLWSYRSFPDLLWTRFHQTPTENLRRWDELTAVGRRVVAVAGNDAHANVGVSLQDLTGRSIFQIKLDPYERSFRVVRTHVLAPRGQAFDADALLAALSAGHAYVAFDLLSDATGFRFTASNGAEQKILGDEIALVSGVRLRVAAPVESRVVLVRDGRRVDEKVARGAEWAVGERGVYRVECYLPQLPAPLGATPWIISNPIYVR
ncbi:MAG: CehA/McbA family metallohydrolase [Acidobacteria bacterium]|nr:CehA/McbA family metallohydrolase [Acidobacteriota bacterium]MCA1643604.1 CehA/McbA family metallohydrolase [Acidobacteriota bacterium]